MERKLLIRGYNHRILGVTLWLRKLNSETRNNFTLWGPFPSRFRERSLNIKWFSCKFQYKTLLLNCSLPSRYAYTLPPPSLPGLPLSLTVFHPFLCTSRPLGYEDHGRDRLRLKKSKYVSQYFGGKSQESCLTVSRPQVKALERTWTLHVDVRVESLMVSREKGQTLSSTPSVGGSK